MTTKNIVINLCVFLVLGSTVGLANNPIIANQGVCDPHIHIFNGKAYLFATHDEKPGNSSYTMYDWWLWSSPDLINWTKVFTLYPADTYIGGTWNKCYAPEGATRNGKYYFYFSKHSLNTGVAVSTAGPEGPYADALGKQLTSGWDPSVFIDDDANKTPYLIYGGFPYKIAKLNEDMISFAETAREIAYIDRYSGWTSSSDGNFIHKRNGLYYLNQHGQKYGTSTNIYGPYTFRGTYFPSWNDHGTFFVWNNQDYLAYGLQDTDNYFRKTKLTYVYYKDNGDIVADTTVAFSSLGVGQYDSSKTIQAEWYFAASDGTSKNQNASGFELRNLGNDSYLYFPNIRNVAANTGISFRVSSANSSGGTIEIRQNSTSGTLLGLCSVPNTGSWTTYQTIGCTLTNSAGDINMCLVFKGTGAELMRLDYFSYPKDAVPPTPNPAQFSAAPATLSSTQISMTAQTGTDNTAGPVQYLFREAGGKLSGWQSIPVYIATNLQPATQYTYTVTMRDLAGNETASSGSFSAFTYGDPDIVINNYVDIADFAALAARWLEGDCYMSALCGGTDLNADGSVSLEDFQMLAFSWLSESEDLHEDLNMEAENYTAMSGIQTETTSDTGGGLNIGWIENGDWAEYTVNVPLAGTYPVDFRVASNTSGGGTINLVVGGSVKGTGTVTGTGGWQSWQTVSTTAAFDTAGTQTVRLNFIGGTGYLYNLNWFCIKFSM